MENKTSSAFESLIESAREYGKTSIELCKLKTIKSSADFISAAMVKVILVSLLVFIFVLISIATALWLGDILGKPFYGFFIMAGFYSILSIFIFLFRIRLIKSPVKNAIIYQALK